VRRGSVIEVAGTTGLRDGDAAAPGAGDQARAALELIVEAVRELGGGPGDIVRTRMFVVDVERNGEAVGLAHGEVLGDVAPVTAMYGVVALMRPDLLVEIEATAILD
jgi:enamine deaminase RidA (YjgF/YER057c/UK114 family)